MSMSPQSKRGARGEEASAPQPPVAGPSITLPEEDTGETEHSRHQPRFMTMPQRLIREARSKSAHFWHSAHDREMQRPRRDYDDARFLDEIIQARENAGNGSSFFQYGNGDDDDEAEHHSISQTDIDAAAQYIASHRGVPSASAGNGIRVWYESYTTIDWIHDAVKESSRLRRVRSLKGARGALLNVWDRMQGWLIVSITGIITALIAGAIVTSEAVLFDLKEGYCERDWRLAKRFCCPYGGQPDWDGNHLASSAPSLINDTRFLGNSSLSPWSYHTRFMRSTKHGDIVQNMLVGSGTQVLAGWASPSASSPKWRKIEDLDSCPGWKLWGDKLHLSGQEEWIADYGLYIGVAILWASIACLLTIYLTSSELYITSKTNSSTVQGSRKPQHSHEGNEEATERSPLLGRRRQASARSYDATPNIEDQRNESGGAVPHKLLSQMAKAEQARQAIPGRKVLYFGSGSGISEVKCILSGFVIHGYLGFWTLFTKSVGLTLAVASGLSLGKEGPFVHIASCVGNIVCRIFPKYERNESKRREILSCACAAGVAVAFGAPVGGVLFSLEEVSYYFPGKVMFRSFFCAMIAAAGLRFLDPFGTGKIVLFQVTYDRDWHWVELIFFVLIGLFGGLYGAFFTRMNYLWSTKIRGKTWMARRPLLEVIMITVISVVVSFLNDYTKMSGPELIADLFSECHEHESLDGLCVSRPSQIGPLLGAVAWTMAVKGILTIITFGIKLPAGIFIPTLAVGACFGRLVGLIVQYTQWTHQDAKFFEWCPASETSCIVPGIYAMVGAAAALSGVTRTTISLVVIMFELTGTLAYAVPVMLAVLVARTVADALESKSIYDLVLDFSGLPYLDAKEEHVWSNVTILDAVDTGVEIISLDEPNTVSSLRQKLERLASLAGNPDGGFPILASVNQGKSSSLSSRRGSRLAGYISAQELEHGLNRLVEAYSLDDSSQLQCTFDFLPRPAKPATTGATTPGVLDASALLSSRNSMEALVPGTPIGNEIAEHGMFNSTVLNSIDEPHDLSLFVDRAPLTLSTSSPLELVHQLFVKLGVRYLVVLRPDGSFKGIIFKKRWLAFLHSLEHGKHK